MPWFWRTSNSNHKNQKSEDEAVRVVERQVSRGSSFSSFISRRSGSIDHNWEQESAGIELQPPSQNSTAPSGASSLSMRTASAETPDADESSSSSTPDFQRSSRDQQNSAFMVAEELEIEEPPAPAQHHYPEEKKKSGGILSGAGWRARGNSIVSLKAIGRKKSNSVSSEAQQAKDSGQQPSMSQEQELR